MREYGLSLLDYLLSSTQPPTQTNKQLPLTVLNEIGELSDEDINQAPTPNPYITNEW